MGKRKHESGMGKGGFLLLLMLAGSVFFMNAAEFKGRLIDGKHYSASMWMKGQDTRYLVDVVFLKRAANIFFKPGQMLPATVRNDRYMTLYLEDETIDSLSHILLKQVVPPEDMDETDRGPADWEAGAFWIMRINPEKK